MSNSKCIWFFQIVAFLLIFIGSTPDLHAEELKGMDVTLEGLRSIFVQVAPLNSETKEKGFSEQEILKKAEQRMRNAGIKILEEEEYERLKGSRRYPLARVDLIMAVKEIEDKEIIIFDIQVQVRQVAFLARKPVIDILAPTWEKRILGHTNSLSVINKEMAKAVEHFIEAYSTANPESR